MHKEGLIMLLVRLERSQNNIREYLFSEYRIKNGYWAISLQRMEKQDSSQELKTLLVTEMICLEQGEILSFWRYERGLQYLFRSKSSVKEIIKLDETELAAYFETLKSREDKEELEWQIRCERDFKESHYAKLID